MSRLNWIVAGKGGAETCSPADAPPPRLAIDVEASSTPAARSHRPVLEVLPFAIISFPPLLRSKSKLLPRQAGHRRFTRTPVFWQPDRRVRH